LDVTRRDQLAAALWAIRREIPPAATLIVVTKTFPISDVMALYELGERNFGENREGEGAEKSAALPVDAIWHFQGAIQSKKIRSIVSWADYIHSLDDIEHAKKIAAAARELGKVQRVFIQINLDTKPSESRSGIPASSLESFINSLSALSEIEVVGVMGIAPLGEDPAPAFARLAELSKQLRHLLPEAGAISAGMSGDFRVALSFGATHLRIGSSILGSR